jgi:hypothetical protein
MILNGATGLLAAAAIAAVMGWHDVPTAVTAVDRAFAGRILSEAGYGPGEPALSDLTSFEGQVRAIAAVQDAVLKASPKDEGVALDRGREPKDLVELGQGLCFDRSRVMEKILSALGFSTRHASIYSTAERPALLAMLTPENSSHAVTEVKTAKGWMVIDSNIRWIGLDGARNPVSLDGLKAMAERSGPWSAESLSPISWIFLEDFVFVRGLYSRHGRFYAPYTPVPDVNLMGLLDNL